MAEEITKDLYDMTEEEFQQAFARAQAEQPRDDKGRFVAAEGEQEQQQEEQPTVFRREIDLKDGSGVQVFEASTPEELIDKLVTAQENATRKIRELSAERKKEEPAPQKKAAANLTEEEKFILAQEMLTDPESALDKMFERKTGRKLDKLGEDLADLNTFRQHQSEHQASVEFVSRHPEYEPLPQNADKLIKWLKINSLPGTVENLEKAYTDLSESGLLVTKPAEKEEGKGESGDTEQERIAPTKVIIQKRSSSGLTAKRGSVTKPELTTEDLYNMPMDEFLKLGGMTKNGW